MLIDQVAAQIVSDLRATDRLRRRHASFWNFARKGPKEMGVFTEAMQRISEDLPAPISGWRPVDLDPPDVELTSGDERIGVEITELVNPRALRAQVHQNYTYSQELLSYGPEQAKAQIAEIVAEKEAKIRPVIAQYDSVALLIHTDEPMLTSKMLTGHRLQPGSEVYRWVYLLFSYEPEKGECPLVRLQ
jgi:hypothetical protein